MTYTTYIKDEITNETLCVRKDNSITELFKELRKLPLHCSAISICDDEKISIIRWSDVFDKRIELSLKE